MSFERASGSRQRPPQGLPPNFISSEAQATTFGAAPGGGVSAFAIDAGAICPDLRKAQ